MLKVIAATAMVLAGGAPAGAAYWSGYGDWIEFLKDQDRGERLVAEQSTPHVAMPPLEKPAGPPAPVIVGNR